MREAEVEAAFVRALEADGWTCVTSPRAIDVTATRGRELLLAEVKGHTTGPGLDVDTAYGQLLRSIQTPPLEEDRPPDYYPPRYALVVPSGKPLTAARRVPIWVRSTLAIDIYEVLEDDSVVLHGSTPVTDPDNFQATPTEEQR